MDDEAGIDSTDIPRRVSLSNVSYWLNGLVVLHREQREEDAKRERENDEVEMEQKTKGGRINGAV